MKTYIKAGIKDLPSMINHYNSFSDGGPKKTYQEWVAAMRQQHPWLELNSANAGYDYERYFNENYQDAISRLSESEPRHFEDTYKLPSHITFSDESVYSTPRNKGGRWVGDDLFIPSPTNVERYPWLYKAYKPVREEDIYSHRFENGGPEDEIPPYNRAVYNTVNPVLGYPTKLEAIRYRVKALDKRRTGMVDKKDWEVGEDLGSKVSDAAWRKRLGYEYDEKLLPVFNGDTVRLPAAIEREIPIDTNDLKTRIDKNNKLLKLYSSNNNKRKVITNALKVDKETLNALRKTYATGEPVGINEYSWNSRQLINNGEVIDMKNLISPLNVLHNYNIRYDKPTNRMYYSDEYDFNEFEPFVPGKPYRIRGYIDLNKK